MRVALPLCLALASFAAPAFAGDPTDSAPAAGTNIVVKGEADPTMKKVCKNETATGSVMPKRVCRMVSTDPTVRLQEERDLDRIRERQQIGQDPSIVR